MLTKLRFRHIFKGGIDVDFCIRRMQKYQGISSQDKDGRHYLFWDFDSTDINDIVDHLHDIQQEFVLNDIYFWKSSDRGFHAISPTSYPFWQAVAIVASHHLVDISWLKTACMRERFVLRITSIPPGAVITIGQNPPDANWYENLTKVEEYWGDFKPHLASHGT